MEKILLYIKHRLTFLWVPVEKANGCLFRIMFKRKLDRSVSKVLGNSDGGTYQFRVLQKKDIPVLHEFLLHVDKAHLTYFNPHPFHERYLNKLRRNAAFLMLGAYSGEDLIGYFFLRFFVNRACFVGRIISSSQQGKGIGKLMNAIMYGIAWSMGFRCLATISKHNHLVQRAHKSNTHMVIRKKLENDFLLVEFVPDQENKL